MYLVKKTIIYYDLINSSEKLVLETLGSIEMPYLAGELRDIRYKDPNWTYTEGDLTDGYIQTIGEESEEYKSSIFNENGLLSLVMAVDKHTLIYIQVRPNHCLGDLIISPDSIIPDIHYSSENKLLYSFYNLSFHGSVNIKAKLLPDVNDYYNKLKKAPEDMAWRNYIIKKSLAESNSTVNPEKTEVISDKMNVSEAAEVLGIAVKTLRNWTSAGKIPYTKVGRLVRYSRKAIEKYNQKHSHTPKK
jgi:excisionase family DNA binding protein